MVGRYSGGFVIGSLELGAASLLIILLGPKYDLPLCEADVWNARFIGVITGCISCELQSCNSFLQVRLCVPWYVVLGGEGWGGFGRVVVSEVGPCLGCSVSRAGRGMRIEPLLGGQGYRQG